MLRWKFLTCTDAPGVSRNRATGSRKRLFAHVLHDLDTDENQPGRHNQQNQYAFRPHGFDLIAEQPPSLGITIPPLSVKQRA